LDLLVKVPTTSWINKTGHYAAKVQVGLERVLGGAVVDHLDVTFTIDSLQAAARAATARFPGEVRMSIAFRDTDVGDSDGIPENDDLAAWVVGNEVVYPGVALEDHGPLDLRTTVTRTVPASEGPALVSGLVDVAWRGTGSRSTRRSACARPASGERRNGRPWRTTPATSPTLRRAATTST
jgi:hypothetical protein